MSAVQDPTDADLALAMGVFPPRRVAGFAWLIWFCGVAGGLFVGGIVSGKLGLSLEEVSTYIEIGLALPTLIPGTFLLGRAMGRRVHLSGVVRYGFGVICLAAGLMLGLTMSSEEGHADDVAWLQSTGGKVSLTLLGISLVTAIVLSVRRFPATGPPEPKREVTLEEQLYGPNA
jgi:hypothetical protein